MRIQGGLSIAGLLLLVSSCSSGNTMNSPVGAGGGSGVAGPATGATSGGSGTPGASCAFGQTSCSGVCTTTATDLRNCGSCGTACGNGQSCTRGACTCTVGLSACGTACFNTNADPANCGACGTVCTGGLVCSRSQCSASCAAGETQCGASCTSTQVDSFNCGFCSNVCAGGQACVNGACGCPAGQATCAGTCVDTQSNASNCGTCGKACGAGQSCVGGVCSGAGSAGAAGSAGVGGSSGNTGTAGSPPGRNGCALAPGMIADFEEGGMSPVVIAHEDRSGEWEMFNDASASNQTMAVAASGGGAPCDTYALRVTGSGYSSWGAGFGFSLVGPKTAPVVYNAAQKQFTGIRFKAKLGTGADAKSPVRFNISSPWTESSKNPGGQCQPRAATATRAAVDCYQHAGGFLAPGAGAADLTQQWKTFSYCFDRDFYPLSLPSNLTTEQRNNLASSILKVQFQFNQAKDYSGPYPANAQYPSFAKSLPFDFWIDDISFTTGECPNMVASPSNGSPAKPFPQNTAVGYCMPATNASKFAAAIAEAYARWKQHFVQGNRIVAPEQQNVTTSEAMGYGMMIAAAMGDKTTFDSFHGYVTSKINGGTGLMGWKDGDSGSASDGDIDIAYALLMAGAQWGGAYKAAGDAMAAKILQHDLVNNIVRGGSSFQGAPFNPSYFAPAAFRAFGSGFTAAIAANYSLVNANVGAATSGIPTDWANPSTGAPSGPGSAQVTSQITDGENGAMGYDSARVPWRLGLDACLGSGSATALGTIVSAFGNKYDGGASIDLMKAGWYKRNGEVHPAAKDSQGSYIGPMGVGGMAMNNVAMRDRAFRAMLDVLANGDFNHTYFPSTVGLLTLLMLSGNFPTP